MTSTSAAPYPELADPERAPRRPSKVDSIRPAYSFDDVSLAPGVETIDPADVDVSAELGGLRLAVPILASAMDAVVDPAFAGTLARLGGLAVLNLEGLHTRYEDADRWLERIATARPESVQDLLAEAYGAPVRDDLIARRIDEVHAAGSPAAVAATPAAARRLGPFCAEHGADLFIVQSQVSSARHLAAGYEPLALAEFTRYMPIPVAVGNTTSYEAALGLMEQGAAAVFVGVGPGAACTTRDVLGIGVPQVTAISDVAAARDEHHQRTGRYVPVVADGGMRRGGELAKAIAAGADLLMLGSPLARAAEAPGRGTNWGMAAPSPTLPRGTRINVGTVGSLEKILFGPASVTDGTENLVGALRQSMAALGARDIRAMQQVEIVYAPGVATEGKAWQRAAR
ncbi:MAG TPA: GuaB3 family IMP dehydrogenase-related protein [Candidatus Limnocylindrales bacterium]|nr:GuaB3 family IMP dehydrogenase-related protein [Candidatus Limnocylindrales bacterium]